LLTFNKGIVAEAGLDSSKHQLVGLSGLAIQDGSDWQIPSCAQELERQRLLQHIDRNLGKWDQNHPRWRLFEALHGFDNYREIAGAEIDRFEDLYKHVPQRHKQVVTPSQA
jgi:hypothetical protein